MKDVNSVLAYDKTNANKFNEHFCQLVVLENLNRSIDACNFRDYIPHSQASSVFLEKVIPAEIHNIKEFKSEK